MPSGSHLAQAQQHSELPNSEDSCNISTDLGLIQWHYFLYQQLSSRNFHEKQCWMKFFLIDILLRYHMKQQVFCKATWMSLKLLLTVTKQQMPEMYNTVASRVPFTKIQLGNLKNRATGEDAGDVSKSGSSLKKRLHISVADPNLFRAYPDPIEVEVIFQIFKLRV